MNTAKVLSLYTQTDYSLESICNLSNFLYSILFSNKESEMAAWNERKPYNGLCLFIWHVVGIILHFCAHQHYQPLVYHFNCILKLCWHSDTGSAKFKIYIIWYTHKTHLMIHLPRLSLSLFAMHPHNNCQRARNTQRTQNAFVQLASIRIMYVFLDLIGIRHRTYRLDNAHNI